MVTAAWPRADIASRSGYRVLQETEMALEPRAIVARSDGPDPTELLVALDDAIRALRADGMLTDLARRPGDVAARSVQLARRGEWRWPLLAYFTLAFVTAGIAGAFGAFITKAAPIY